MKTQNQWGDKTLRCLSPAYDKVPIHIGFKKVVNDLIGTRPMIFTKKLEFQNEMYWNVFLGRVENFKIYRLPVDLKIHAEVLESSGFSFSYDELDVISTILGPKPLKEFSTKLDIYEIFTHPIILNSEKLVLHSGRVHFNHQRINHRHIHLKDYDQQVLIDHMNVWIRNNNEIGMEFSGDIETDRVGNYIDSVNTIKEMMHSKMRESGGSKVKADKRFLNTLYSISMPRTNAPNTEIQFSLLRNGFKLQIHLKIQSSGTAIPERIHAMHLERETDLGFRNLYF
ncbi:unnamed protein product [Caenorhabditis nigoni]